MRTTICVSFILLAAACGDDSSNMDAAAPQDMAVADDMTVGPELTGTKLTSGSKLQLLTVLDDDTVIFSSAPTAMGVASLQAIPAAGGTPTTIDASWSNVVAFKNGVVLAWDGVSGGVGNLSSWSKAQGLKSLSTTSTINFTAAASTDGSQIFYASGASGDGMLSDLYVSDTAGTAPKMIVSQKPTAFDCMPDAFFTNTKLIVSYCNDAVDAGVRTVTVLSVDPSTGTPTTLFTDARADYRFTVDLAGTKVFTIDAMDNAKVVDIVGGSPTTIEASVGNGFVTKDDTAFVYQTMSGALKRVTLAAPTTPTTLVAMNVNGIQSPFLSPDGTKALLYNMQSGTDSVVRDLYLADTTTANQTAVALDSAVETQLYGDPFSADNSRVVFFTNTANGLGTMKSVAVGGGAAAMIATKVWLARAVTGTKYLYNDGYVGKPTGNGRADLHVTDVASAGTSTLIATQANSDSFFLTKDKSKVVYLYDAMAANAGIYAATIP